MSTERKFQGIWIPAAIWMDRSLSITEKVMLVEINSLEQPDRGCYAGNDYFSGFFDLSKSRVSEIISNLAANDLVRVVLIREGKQIVGRQIWMTKKGRSLTNGTPPSSENTHTPPSEKAATPFGKGGDPSSEKAKENNTDSNNTKSNKSKPSAAPATDTELQAACKATWESYKKAYCKEYGIDPLRSASVNTNIKAFCKRVPHDEAPQIAAFFLTLKDSYYVQMMHAISVMLGNAEPLRTRWATGRTKIITKPEKFDSFAYVNRNAIQPGAKIEKPIN